MSFNSTPCLSGSICHPRVILITDNQYNDKSQLLKVGPDHVFSPLLRRDEEGPEFRRCHLPCFSMSSSRISGLDPDTTDVGYHVVSK